MREKTKKQQIYFPRFFVCVPGEEEQEAGSRGPSFFPTPFLLLGNLISKLSPPLSYSAAPLLLLLRHLFPLSTGGLL